MPPLRSHPRRGLPEAGERVPGVAGVEPADGVATPGGQQVRTGGGDVDDVGAARIMAHRVDWASEVLELGDEPVAVCSWRGVPSLGRGNSKPGGGQPQDVGPVEGIDEPVQTVGVSGFPCTRTTVTTSTELWALS